MWLKEFGSSQEYAEAMFISLYGDPEVSLKIEKLYLVENIYVSGFILKL